MPSSAICCSKLSHLYQTPSPLPVPRLKRRQIDRGAPLPPSPTAGTAARTCTPRLSCPFPARPGCIGGHISLAEQGRAAASPGARAHTRAQRRSRGRRRRDSAHLVEEHHVVVCLSSLRRGDNIGTVEGRCLRIERQHALFLWEVETAGRVHQLHKDERCTVSPGVSRAQRGRGRGRMAPAPPRAYREDLVHRYAKDVRDRMAVGVYLLLGLVGVLDIILDAGQWASRV